MNIDLRLGDCIEVLKTIPDNSIDSIVTDPPYGLEFMGKKWDYDVPSVDIWRECLRVLKPGGHLLSFAGSRTYHRMAVRIEDAGFEIRDQIMWVYGSGFPKSLNIGKAIDKKDNPETWKNNEYGGGNYKCPNCDKWIISGNPCKCPREVKEIHNEWEGWGTALKPAHEPIVMARKPLSEKSIAENVLKHGTGGINIDGSRIELDLEKEKATGDMYYHLNNKKYPNQESSSSKIMGSKTKRVDLTFSDGRFPANIIFDEEAGKLLDEQSGISKGNKPSKRNKEHRYSQDWGHRVHDGMPIIGYDDLGGASRFFYCPKTSKKDRGENNHPTVKPTDLMRYLINLVTPKGGTTLDPFMGSGSTGKAAVQCAVNFIGIEKEEEYMKIAEARINHERNKPRQQELF